MTVKSRARNALTSASIASLCATVSVAQAQDKPMEVKISGHVNRMLMYVDDGQDNTVFNVDNVNSQTRFRFVGSKEFAPGWSAGINWEVGWTSQRSDRVNFGDRDGAATALNERHTEAILSSAQFGSMRLGQGDGAANGNIEIDLSGTKVVQYANASVIGGAFTFREGGVVGPSIGSTTSDLDFESRYDRIRYDTPKLGPLALSGSYGNTGQNSVYEIGARISSRVGGGVFATGMGYSLRKNISAVANDSITIGGSVSYLSSIGVNASLAYSNRHDDTPGRNNRTFYYAKLGYKIAKHAASIDYGRTDDLALDGDEARTYGIAYVYKPAPWIELYANAKQHELDRPGTNFHKISFLIAGTRIKF